MNVVHKAILQTIQYFSFFSYAPSLDELYRFLPLKTTKKKLRLELNYLTQAKLLIKKTTHIVHIHKSQFLNLNSCLYTIPPQGILLDKRTIRSILSEKKIKRVMPFIKPLGRFAQIRLIGLSGAVSMMNAGTGDDVDLFMITAENRLWTGRLISLLVAEIYGLRRGRGSKQIKDKVCLNLFFEDGHLAVPYHKRNRYVAHEILQMKPIVAKDNVYERFLAANRWVGQFCPNSGVSRPDFKNHDRGQKYRGRLLEWLLKKSQLFLINRHRTIEIIGKHQLWFFPNDFEQKLRRKGII